MNHNIVVERLCQFVTDYKRGAASAVECMKATGYPECKGCISLEEIEGYLLGHIELVRQWVDFSADNRSSPSWYLLDPESNPAISGKWHLGYYPGGEVTVFSNGTTACAAFILTYADQVLSVE